MVTEDGRELDGDGLYPDAQSSISLWSGGRINPLDPKPEDIHLEDIAHALARQCRYNGHVMHHLSVARHSIWVSEFLDGTGLELWGLLHDAGEAYLGDLVKPIKRDPSMAVFVEAEYHLDEALAKRFDLPFPMPQLVRDADQHVTVNLEIGERRRWRWRSSAEADEADFLKRYMAVDGPKLDYGPVTRMSDYKERTGK